MGQKTNYKFYFLTSSVRIYGLAKAKVFTIEIIGAMLQLNYKSQGGIL
jgi:hypothetical protein